MFAMWVSGETLTNIAKKYEVLTQNVSKIKIADDWNKRKKELLLEIQQKHKDKFISVQEKLFNVLYKRISQSVENTDLTINTINDLDKAARLLYDLFLNKLEDKDQSEKHLHLHLAPETKTKILELLIKDRDEMN